MAVSGPDHWCPHQRPVHKGSRSVMSPCSPRLCPYGPLHSARAGVLVHTTEPIQEMDTEIRTTVSGCGSRRQRRWFRTWYLFAGKIFEGTDCVFVSGKEMKPQVHGKHLVLKWLPRGQKACEHSRRRTLVLQESTFLLWVQNEPPCFSFLLNLQGFPSSGRAQV